MNKNKSGGDLSSFLQTSPRLPGRGGDELLCEVFSITSDYLVNPAFTGIPLENTGDLHPWCSGCGV